MKMKLASLAVGLAVLAPGVSHAADGFRNSSNASVEIRFGPAGTAVSYGYGANDRYDNWNRYNRGGWVNRYQAIRIAQGYGLARLTDLDFDNGFWEVEGVTARGARIDVEISARTGRVVDVDYGWRGHGRRFRGHDHHAHRDHDGRGQWRRGHDGRYSRHDDDRRGGWDRRGDRRGDWDGRGDRDRSDDRDRRGDRDTDSDRDRRGDRNGRGGRGD